MKPSTGKRLAAALGDSWREGVRAGLPVAPPTLVLGVTFGVLAKPVMGTIAPIAMTISIFSSFAISSRGDGTFDPGLLIGATIPQVVAWITGTVIGGFSGSILSDPARSGSTPSSPPFTSRCWPRSSGIISRWSAAKRSSPPSPEGRSRLR